MEKENHINEDEFIKGHEDAINNQQTSDYFKNFPENINLMGEQEKQRLLGELIILEKRFNLLIPYIKDTKNYISSITERTKFSACFLLFHKMLHTWEAVLILSRKGFYYEVMELSRSTSENADLAKTFILEDGDNFLINKWFNGEIVEHAKSRLSFEKVFNTNDFFQENFQVAKILSKIYRTMSQYTHGGYAPMLELVNVFTKDFDFDKTAGFHRLDEQINVLKSLVNNIHHTLIFFYIFLAKNKDKTEELRNLIPIEFSKQLSKDDLKKYFEEK